ncbi:hypothetical protein J7J81_01195 [bacterium]|nr:hypothetical protein [bacterium]
MKRREEEIQQFPWAIRCDRYDRAAFSQLKQKSEKLVEMERNGIQTLPVFSDLIQDIYSALYKADPQLRKAGAVVPSRRVNRMLMEKLLATKQYPELRQYTELDEFGSAMATLTLGPVALELIPEETKQKIQQLQQQEQKSQQLQQQTQDLQQQAEAAQGQADDLQQQAQTATGTQAQQLQQQAQQMQQQANSLGQQTSQAQMTLDEAKQQLEQMADGLEQDLQQNSEQFRRGMRKAAKEAAENAKETSEMLESWGVEPGEIQKLDYEQKLELKKKLESSSKLKQISKLLGKFRRLAIARQKEKIQAPAGMVVNVRRGNDLDKVIPSEMQFLAHPVLKMEFLRKFANQQLLQYEVERKEKLGEGPIIVGIDNSGSMEGAKEIWAKAVALGLWQVSKSKRRDFVYLMFGSRDDPIKEFWIRTGEANYKKLIQMAEFFLGGGTDFEKPLGKAQEIVESGKLPRADICFVTDGECAVSDSFREQFQEFKRKEEVQVVTVLVDVGSSSRAAAKEFSDEIVLVSELNSEEAGEVFGKV